MESPPRSANNAASHSLIPPGLLPAYLAAAFGEVYEEDGLVVVAKGLGWMNLLAAFARFYADAEHGHLAISRSNTSPVRSRTRPPLVIILGLRDSEHSILISLLEAWGTPQHMLPIIITNESGQGKDRAGLYQRGGVFCITSRILIVDLLTNILASKEVDGLLISHADDVANDSTEAFIIRIFVSQNRREQCFIKAFTDSPEAMLSGFAKIDKILKALHIRRLYLYPRFHTLVKQELEHSPPDVEELFQPLSPTMKEIQAALATAVHTCLRELKESTPFIEWNGVEFSIANCVTSNFDRAVARKLDSDWHRLKPQTKQLKTDLRSLRTLFTQLIQADCVSFWKLINTFKTLSIASRHPSLWLLTPAAEVVFKKAKERIYHIERGVPTARLPNPVSVLRMNLEENPKWRLLKKVLSDIMEKESQREQRRNVTILVLAREEHLAETLQSYLVDGRDRTMAKKWLNYLERYNDRSRSVGDMKMSEESRLLLEEEGRVRRVLFGEKQVQSSVERAVSSSWPKQPLNELPGCMRKRRRVGKEKARVLPPKTRSDQQQQAILDEAFEKLARNPPQEITPNSDLEPDLSELLHDRMTKTFFATGNRVVVETSNSSEASGIILQDLEPDYVIIHDSDVGLVRALEVYAALRSKSLERLKVYFLVFETSSEQKVFLSSLERERNAFERLIHHKKTTPPPVLKVGGTQELQQAHAGGSTPCTYSDGSLPLAFDTRRGQGRSIVSRERRDIAVDVREFRSSLPSILHRGGMRIAPVTLMVGDFVLTNVHCVERKSISDLFGSLANGRLYSQTEAMRKHYKCPMLLIEFDPSKSFCLQNSNEIGMDIRIDSVCSKVALLTMHFPTLRVLWSKSPHETLLVFKELKSNHAEVDLERAVEVGRSESMESLLKSAIVDDEEDEVNEAARDMLVRLPGVNVHIARRIMRECDSLVDLAMLDRTGLRRIAGPVAGQKLFSFFRQNFTAT